MTDIPPKPQTHNGDIGSLPPALERLRGERVWVCWCWFWNGKKWTKPPRRVDDPSRNASSSNPATWGSHEEAVAQVRAGDADGIGFALKGRNIGGIDLDHCRDPVTGQIEPWADDYVRRLPGAYVEATVSGKGLRILGTSKLESFAPKFKLNTGNGAAIELFSNSYHYLTLSCNEIGSCTELPPIGETMASIEAELGAPSKQDGLDFDAIPRVDDAPPSASESERAPPNDATPWSFAEEARLRAALGAIPTDEKALAEKFGHSHDTWVKIGRAIERLDWGEHGYAIFRDWSAQNAKEFNEKGLRTQWASFKRNRNARENPATIASVYYYARKFGWSSQSSNNKISDVEEKPSTDVPALPLSIDVWLKRDLPAPDYLIGNWLTTTRRVLFASDTGLGKTNFALAAFSHLAAGRSFLHWDIPQPRRVLYVDGEMSRRLLKQRLEDAVRRLGIAPDALHVLSHEDVEGFQPLNTKAGQKYVLEVIKSVRAEAVIFDNIMALIAGDMKDEDAWRATLPLIGDLTKQGIGQLWVHHTGHDATRGYGTKTREWRMDTVMHGTAAERADTDVSFLLEFRKARERTPANRRDFADVTVALVNDQWISDVAAKAAKSKKVSPVGMKFLEALQNVFATDKTTPFQSWQAVTTDQWRAECKTLGLIDEGKPHTARSMMSKYRQELIVANMIACNSDLVWIVRP
jgi:hypothetical protein